MSTSGSTWICTRRAFLQASAGATALAAAAGGLVNALDDVPATFASAPRALPTDDEAIEARHARHRIEAAEGAFVSRHDPWHTCDRSCCGAATAHEF